MSVPPLADEHELPPTVVAEHKTYRCEWCGRPLDVSVEERDLATDVGRKTHRYLPKRYRACDDACRAGVRMFVRRHMALGPLLWSLTVLSFLVAVGALVSVFPPPLRLMMLAPDELLLLLALLGGLGVLTGGLVTLLPYTFIGGRKAMLPPSRCAAPGSSIASWERSWPSSPAWCSSASSCGCKDPLASQGVRGASATLTELSGRIARRIRSCAASVHREFRDAGADARDSG